MHFSHSNGFPLASVSPFTVTIKDVEEKFKAHCVTLALRHLNPITKNCHLSDKGDKEESWITSMLVLGDPCAVFGCNNDRLFLV